MVERSLYHSNQLFSSAKSLSDGTEVASTEHHVLSLVDLWYDPIRP